MVIALYPLAFAIFWVPMVDMIAGSVPVMLDNVAWRFGVLGLLLKTTLVPLMGLAMASTIASFAGHHGLLKVLSIVGFLAAVCLFAGTVLFALDFLQVRGTVGQNQLAGVQRAVLTALCIAGLQIPVAIGIGAGAWKSSRITADGSVRRKQDFNLVTPVTPSERAT